MKDTKGQRGSAQNCNGEYEVNEQENEVPQVSKNSGLSKVSLPLARRCLLYFIRVVETLLVRFHYGLVNHVMSHFSNNRGPF